MDNLYLDITTLLDSLSFFYEYKSKDFVITAQNDDDCERGMFFAYDALLTLRSKSPLTQEEFGNYHNIL